MLKGWGFKVDGNGLILPPAEELGVDVWGPFEMTTSEWHCEELEVQKCLRTVNCKAIT